MLPEIDAYLVRRSAMERAYSLTAIPVEYAFASTRAGTLRSRVPRGTRDARRRAMGEAMAAARVRPTRALRATAALRRPTPRRGRARSHNSSFPVRQVAARPRGGLATTDPISDSPMVGRFWARRVPIVRGRCRKPVAFQKIEGGGQGRNRTTDTRIFSTTEGPGRRE